MNTITAQEVTTALDELRQVIGGSFQLDDEGSCLLTYKDSLPIMIQFIEEDGRLILASELKSGLEDASDAEWLRWLSIDWLGLRARGCALSPDRAAGCVTIWRDVHESSLSGQSLAQALDSFIEELLAAREFVESPNFESATPIANSEIISGRA